MEYCGVHFEHTGKSCKLAGREVTGTVAKNKNESVIKMIDIIDELTGIEKRKMQVGDLIWVNGGLRTILNLQPKTIQYLFNQAIEREPTYHPNGMIFIAYKNHSGVRISMYRKKKYQIHGYEDVMMQTGSYRTNKLVTVWK